MRVIAGKFKGRKLLLSRGKHYRPTLDKVKESIFNVLGNDVIDANVLDLFCGSGSLGIEALSRGAMRTVFVDQSKPAIESARRNVDLLKINHKARFVPVDAFTFMREYEGEAFQLIFADPPYDREYGGKICEYIVNYGILKDGGIFVLERFKKDIPACADLKLVKRLEFGQSEVDFLLKKD